MLNRGTGKRKTSIARVFIDSKSDKVMVNGKDAKDYFKRSTHLNEIMRPLLITKQDGKLGIVAKVEGGGISGQAGAVRHGITRALLDLNPAFREVLKPEGLITRD